MSDYSDEDFEMSGTNTVNTYNSKAVGKAPVGRGIAGKPAQPPFRGATKASDFKLADDDDDGYAPVGQGVTSGDDYEEDDFDEEEEE